MTSGLESLGRGRPAAAPFVIVTAGNIYFLINGWVVPRVLNCQFHSTIYEKELPMEISDARSSAQYALELLIKNQPGLATEKTGNHINDGASLADFCHDFIDQYAKRLMDRKDQE